MDKASTAPPEVRVASDSVSNVIDGEFFEQIYQGAQRDRYRLGWTKPGPDQMLTRWLADEAPTPGRAMVVGCGVGDDAEFLAARGWDVSAFDVSRTAIEWARERSPHSTVEYRVADLFALPEEWHRAFDLVVEVWTIQSIDPLHTKVTISAIAELVAEDGTLLVSTLTSSDADRAAGPPWPVDPAALDGFVEAGLVEVRRDDISTKYPSVGRLEVEFRRKD
ncbi:MAG: class I SAM-dependent methyltransferase [Acidimicrobiia bacterium]|nr:class I SAM-dependent methyltransferase [Acidimicrobiia bacterium]